MHNLLRWQCLYLKFLCGAIHVPPHFSFLGVFEEVVILPLIPQIYSNFWIPFLSFFIWEFYLSFSIFYLFYPHWRMHYRWKISEILWSTFQEFCLNSLKHFLKKSFCWSFGVFRLWLSISFPISFSKWWENYTLLIFSSLTIILQMVLVQFSPIVPMFLAPSKQISLASSRGHGGNSSVLFLA